MMVIDGVKSGMGEVERAHSSMNAAFGALTSRSGVPVATHDVTLARAYVGDAHASIAIVAGTDGPHDAAIAAREMLPRLERAIAILDQLGQAHDHRLVQPLLDELGIAMDHAEAALAAVGWE